MSGYPGRKIISTSAGYDWYMNPEGVIYGEWTEHLEGGGNVVGLSSKYDGTHAIYRDIRPRYSLADVALFHPDLSSKVLQPYIAGVYRLIPKLPPDTSLSDESVRQLSLFNEKYPSSVLKKYTSLRSLVRQLTDPLSLHVKQDSVAIGAGRILVSNELCYVLQPMGALASGLATLSRLTEEMLMIGVLLDAKRPVASGCLRCLAENFIRSGYANYGSALWDALGISLLSHLMRRSQVPLAPKALSYMMDRVAYELLVMKGKLE